MRILQEEICRRFPYMGQALQTPDVILSLSFFLAEKELSHSILLRSLLRGKCCHENSNSCVSFQSDLG